MFLGLFGDPFGPNLEDRSPRDRMSSVFPGHGNFTPKRVFDQFRPCFGVQYLTIRGLGPTKRIFAGAGRAGSDDDIIDACLFRGQDLSVISPASAARLCTGARYTISQVVSGMQQDLSAFARLLAMSVAGVLCSSNGRARERDAETGIPLRIFLVQCVSQQCLRERFDGTG